MFKRVVVAVLMVAALAVSAPGSTVAEAQEEWCGPPRCDWPPPWCEPIVRCAYVPWLGGWFCWFEYPCSA